MILADGAAAAGDRTLPVGGPLAPVLPTLQRGGCVTCAGQAPVGVALALVAEATASGSWLVVAGLPTLGLAAARHAGVALERLVAVHDADTARWADLLAAMIDGFDVILLGPHTHRLPGAAARRLQARAQSKGTVLVAAGEHPALQPDIRVDSVVVEWCGIGAGHGVAHRRALELTVHGRRVPRSRQVVAAWPDVDLPCLGRPAGGGVAVAMPPLELAGVRSA